jgi:hypothetical protein
MKKIDWKQKLGSRKFWAAVIAWLTTTLTAFNVSESVVAQVTLVIAGAGSLIVYILTEGKVDIASIGENADDSEGGIELWKK